MSPNKYPPLTLVEVQNILEVNGFSCVRTKGSHFIYEGNIKGIRRVVTVDSSIDEFNPLLLHSMIHQSGLTREEFYGSTKKTSRKI